MSSGGDGREILFTAEPADERNHVEHGPRPSRTAIMVYNKAVLG